MSATLEMKLVPHFDPEAVTAPMQITKDNSQYILEQHLYKLSQANKRYRVMRQTDSWNSKRLKSVWSTFHTQLVKQNHRCACCKVDIDETACVHTNNDGSLRGLVCFNCNVVLAYARNDSYLLLQTIVYLLGD